MKYLFLLIFFLTKSVYCQEKHLNHNLFGFATSNTFTYCSIYDTSFVKKVKRINPQVLRFPGGAVGNFYHFGKNGYGFDFEEIHKYDGGRFRERSKALVRANVMKGHTHDYIDDFIKLAKITGSKAVLVANMFVDNDDIIMMISKIQDAGIDIIGVELGSELSNRTFYQKGYTIEEYVIDAERCSNKIKKYFPKLRTAIVAAPLHSNPTHRHSIWNKKLANMQFYDDIIVHSYAKVVKGKKEFGQMITLEKEGENLKEAFEIYRERALNFLQFDFENEMKEYQSIFDKPIWITEWNLQISKMTSNTMLQAMFVTQYFLELLSNKDLKSIDLTTYHNMGGRDFGGSIFRNNQETMEVQSPYHPLTFVGKVIDHSNIIIKEEVMPMIFQYKCFDKSDQHLFTILINWSDEYYEFPENHDRLISEFYSQELYYKANINGKLSLAQNFKPDKRCAYEPFSISLIEYKHE